MAWGIVAPDVRQAIEKWNETHENCKIQGKTWAELKQCGLGTTLFISRIEKPKKEEWQDWSSRHTPVWTVRRFGWGNQYLLKLAHLLRRIGWWWYRDTILPTETKLFIKANLHKWLNPQPLSDKEAEKLRKQAATADQRQYTRAAPQISDKVKKRAAGEQALNTP